MTPGVTTFWVLAVLAGASALLSVLFRNPVRSALALVTHMLVLAALFLSLSAQFVAAVQVIVYAGAIMVLFLFAIMLLNVGAPSDESRRSRIGLTVATVTALGLALAMVGGAVCRVGLSAGKASSVTLSRGGAVETIGYALYDPELPWLFVFELTSVLLLAAVVGAVVLARRRP
jgi:NADH-quinone oxidoreductase subunit J